MYLLVVMNDEECDRSLKAVNHLKQVCLFGFEIL